MSAESELAVTPRSVPASACHARFRVLLVLFTLSLSGLDVWTKAWAFELVPHPGRKVAVIDGFFYIAHAVNPGAMWSMAQGVSREIWIAVRGGVFLILLVLVLRAAPTSWWARAGFVLVLAGALGNLYDNIFFEEAPYVGPVRDWLRFDFGDWTFPIFNLADSYICIGAPLLLLHFYRSDEGSGEQPG